MERSDSTQSKRIRWKKIGGGFFCMPTRIIKPGQVFWATLEEIPPAFRDVVIPYGEEEVKKVEIETKAIENIPVVEPQYSKKVRTEGGMWYDIIDKNGKVINEKALREDQANEMLKSLMP